MLGSDLCAALEVLKHRTLDTGMAESRGLNSSPLPGRDFLCRCRWKGLEPVICLQGRLSFMNIHPALERIYMSPHQKIGGVREMVRGLTGICMA